MSTRQLRRLRERELKATQPVVSEEDSDTETLPPARMPSNPFASLGQDLDDESTNGLESQHQSEAEDDTVEVVAGSQAATGAKKSRKKKKKSKAKKKQGSPPVEEDTEKKDGQGEDEIDRALRELGIKAQAPGGGASGASSPQNAASETLLSTNLHNLRDIHELRQVFGRDTIDVVAQQGRTEQRVARRRGHGRTRREADLDTFLRGEPGRTLPRVSLRNNPFIEGREHWPQGSLGGLSMREVERDSAGRWVEYTYVHDATYEKTQTAFFGAVGTGDPIRLVHLLKANPYHISTLLQVSFFAKQDDNNSLAAELCERALFTFGRATLSTFRKDLEMGRARLDFRRPENRQFWLAGYHYLRGLARKGAMRTAFAWAKLIFSVDPQGDPYGMCHVLHVLAIKAHESEWLESFVAAFEKSSLHGDIRYYKNTLVLGLLQRNDREGALRKLVQNMEEMPWLYCALFQQLNLDAPRSIWGVQPPGEADEFYTALYLDVAGRLWDFPLATSLLNAAAKEAEKQANLEATNCVMEFRTARFIYLEGKGDLMSRVPREYIGRQPNYEFDPLPPLKEENIFSTQSSQLPFNADAMSALVAMAEAGPGAGFEVDYDDDSDTSLSGDEEQDDGGNNAVQPVQRQEANWQTVARQFVGEALRDWIPGMQARPNGNSGSGGQSDPA